MPNRRIHPTKTLQICTYNVRTISKEHLDFFLEELKAIKWDIVGLCETKLAGTFVETVSDGHHLYNSGVPENVKRQNGVGFLIRNNLFDSIIDFEPINDRIAVLKVKGKYNNLVIIQAYAPTHDHLDEDLQEFYNELQNAIDKVSNRDILLVNGDMNCKVGGLDKDEPEVLGKHNNVTRSHNERGKTFVNFCKRNELFITNTNFKHRSKYTWTSPDGRTKNTIDYICIRKKALKFIKDSRIVSKPDISDHRLVRCKMTFSFLCQKKFKSKNVRYNIKLLEEETILNNYQNELKNHLPTAPNTNEGAKEILQRITSAITKTSAIVLGKPPKINKEWITPETVAKIKEKYTIRKEFGSNSIQYKISKNLCKKLCRVDKQKFIDEIHKNINQLPFSMQYFKSMKKLSKTKRIKNWSVKSHTGEVLTDRDQIIQRWHKFYSDLYFFDRQTFPTIEEHEPIPEATNDEIHHALNQLKKGKSPGPDNIVSEQLCAGGTALHSWLKALVNQILKSGLIPQCLNSSEIITLYKKGDPLNCENYRPISLLSHIYKLLMQVIYNRIKDKLTNCLPPFQAAYQPNRSTIEQIQIIQQTIEKSLEFQQSIVICFVDYKKAFDSINQTKLWEALHFYTDIDPAYINLLAAIYENATTKIRTCLGTTDLIKLLKGVRQGDILSALLFCIVLLVILATTFDDTEMGIKLAGLLLTYIAFADDLALVTYSVTEMNEVLQNLQFHSQVFGLSINISKTKYMLIGNHPDGQFCEINGEQLEKVENFQYLGRTINNSNNDLKAVDKLISKGWDAFNKVKSILKSKTTPMITKQKTIETYILPCVLYASETITWRKNLLRKMEIFQNDIMRSCLNKRRVDRFPINELRQKTKLTPIISLIKQRKLSWYGHIKRSDLPVRSIYEGMTPGYRCRGRPTRRWRDDLREWTGKTFGELNRMVECKGEWRSYIKGF